jgi:polyisoprenoid-binding protein YceI
MRRVLSCTAILLTALASGKARAQEPAGRDPVALDVKASGAKTFYVDDRAGANQVTIFSESTLDDFTVVCNKLMGEWTFNPQDVEGLKGRFSLKVDNLRTGIELRDHHLRSADWLDAAKYPDVVIKVTRAEDAKRVTANTASMTLVGTCSLHGVTRDVKIPCTLTYLVQSPETMQRVMGDLIRIRAKFDILLSDYKIFGPAGTNIIGLKVANNLPIWITVFGSTQRPPEPLAPQPGGPVLPPPGTSASQPAGAPTSIPSILRPPTRPPPTR